ncbi:MAG: histidine kinase [Desulfurococcales archaeon ex4484_58]|nr:MAG: histidine kinase [Desulfurococcales archaeon ex4484_58]
MGSRYPAPKRIKRRREYRWLRSDGTPDISDRIYRLPGDLEIIASKPVVSVSPTTPLIKALESMAANYRSLIVSIGDQLKGLLLASHFINYLGGGELFKIVSERHNYNIYSALEREVVESIMEKNPVVAYVDEKLTDVLERMVLTGVGVLPVLYDDQRVYGIVTEHDLVKYLYGVVRIGVKVSQIMSSPVITANIDDKLSDVMVKMVKYGFRRLPIIQDNIVVGIVTVMDIIKYFSSHKFFEKLSSPDVRKVLSTSIREVVVPEVVTVGPEADLSEAVHEMIDRNISSVLVVNKDMELQGIVTERDVLYALTVSEIK